jgi:hypothetical protein
MLIKIKKLVIEHKGHRRDIFYKNVYVNSSSIVSITDYEGAQNFLLSENSEFSNTKFSLLRVNQGSNVEDIIAFGTADHIFSTINEASDRARLLNG